MKGKAKPTSASWMAESLKGGIQTASKLSFSDKTTIEMDVHGQVCWSYRQQSPMRESVNGDMVCTDEGWSLI